MFHFFATSRVDSGLCVCQQVADFQGNRPKWFTQLEHICCNISLFSCGFSDRTVFFVTFAVTCVVNTHATSKKQFLTNNHKESEKDLSLRFGCTITSCPAKRLAGFFGLCEFICTDVEKRLYFFFVPNLFFSFKIAFLQT